MVSDFQNYKWHKIMEHYSNLFDIIESYERMKNGAQKTVARWLIRYLHRLNEDDVINFVCECPEFEPSFANIRRNAKRKMEVLD